MVCYCLSYSFIQFVSHNAERCELCSKNSAMHAPVMEYSFAAGFLQGYFLVTSRTVAWQPVFPVFRDCDINFCQVHGNRTTLPEIPREVEANHLPSLHGSESSFTIDTYIPARLQVGINICGRTLGSRGAFWLATWAIGTPLLIDVHRDVAAWIRSLPCADQQGALS
jgi:hypothetical protein